MDENNAPEDKKTDKLMELEREDSAKRMRTDFDHEECSTSSNNSNSHEPSASSDSGLAASNAEPDSSNHGESQDSEETLHSTERVNEDLENEEQLSPPSELNESYDSDVFMSPLGLGSEDTVMHSTDMESDDEEAQLDVILKKEKPKHTWFVVPEIINRQIGYGSKKSNPSLFQQRCYGSLRNVQKLELMYKLEEHEGCVNSLNFSPNGNLLASGSDDLKVVLWDWKIGKSLIKINTPHKRNIFQTKFLHLNGPDLHLATCGRDGQVGYIQVSNDGVRESRKFGQHRGPCHKLSVLKDQPHVILSAGEDGIVFNHDVRRNKPERIVHVKENSREVALYSINSHPLNTHEFCVAGREASVRVYDQRNASRSVTKFCPYKETDSKFSRGLHITCALYNHDGTEVLASYNDDDIYLFDTNKGTGQYIHRYSGHRNAATIKGVSFFGPRSEFIMSGSDCAHVFFWDKKTEAITQFLLADDNGVVNCLEPHPMVPFLATSGLDWDIKLWVPSCEEEPSMGDLASTIKENKRACWGNYEASSESQVLWMLWRRLRAARIRGETDENNIRPILRITSSDDSSLDSETSHSEDESPNGCNSS